MSIKNWTGFCQKNVMQLSFTISKKKLYYHDQKLNVNVASQNGKRNFRIISKLSAENLAIALENWTKSTINPSKKVMHYSICKFSLKIFCDGLSKKTKFIAYLNLTFSLNCSISKAIHALKVDIQSNWDMPNSYI